MKTKVLAVLLTALMVTVITGCGKQNMNKPNEDVAPGVSAGASIGVNAIESGSNNVTPDESTDVEGAIVGAGAAAIQGALNGLNGIDMNNLNLKTFSNDIFELQYNPDVFDVTASEDDHIVCVIDNDAGHGLVDFQCNKDITYEDELILVEDSIAQYDSTYEVSNVTLGEYAIEGTAFILTDAAFDQVIVIPTYEGSIVISIKETSDGESTYISDAIEDLINNIAIIDYPRESRDIEDPNTVEEPVEHMGSFKGEN